MNKRKYYIVSAEALPEIFIKVAEAKRMLQVGEAATVGEAARKTGISRSAFYKYRDAVLPFQNMMTGRIITFQMVLHDNPGVLSGMRRHPEKGGNRHPEGAAGAGGNDPRYRRGSDGHGYGVRCEYP